MSNSNTSPKRRYSWRFILLVILAILAIIFGIQNSQPVTIRYLGFEATLSLALVLFIALLSGILMMFIYSIPSYFRRK